MRLFLVVVLLVWAMMHVYVFLRAWSIPIIVRHLPRYFLAGLACFLSVSYVFARVLHHFGIDTLARIMEVIGANWIGILFLFLVALLVVDVVTLFGRFMPHSAPPLRGWALLAGGLLSIVALVQGHRAPIVTSYEVQLPGLPADSDGSVVVYASDFHLGTMLGKDWLGARIDQIQAERPDIIILGGDIIEGDDPSERELLPALRKLSAPFGVWGVTGNHEFHAETQGGVSLLERSGISLLQGRWVEVRPGLILAGVDDLTSRRRHEQTGNFIAQALAGRPASTPTILISHTPWGADVAAKSGVRLMLSSHTHEGQIWPFNHLVRLTYPFLAGRYALNGLSIIVCRGTGTWGPRMRLWRRGEILRITLRSVGAA